MRGLSGYPGYRRPTSIKTRIETTTGSYSGSWCLIIADRHPLKQGLKREMMLMDAEDRNIADRHPLKQGLKQHTVDGTEFTTKESQTDIH